MRIRSLVDELGPPGHRILTSRTEFHRSEAPIVFGLQCVGKHPWIPLQSYLYSFSYRGDGIGYYQSGPVRFTHTEPYR